MSYRKLEPTEIPYAGIAFTVTDGQGDEYGAWAMDSEEIIDTFGWWEPLEKAMDESLNGWGCADGAIFPVKTFKTEGFMLETRVQAHFMLKVEAI